MKDRLDVVRRWQSAQTQLRTEQEQLKHGGTAPSHCVFLRVKNATHAAHEKRTQTLAHDTKLQPKRGLSKIKTPLQHKHITADKALSSSSSDTTLVHADSAAFEDAIQESINATSRGNPREDELIERAIRASVAELRIASREGEENEAIQRAVQASVAEATRACRSKSLDEEYMMSNDREELEMALQRSLSLHPHDHEDEQPPDCFDDSGIDTDDDVNIKEAIRKSSIPTDHPSPLQEDLQLARAIEESRLTQEENQRRLIGERTEEDIVMDYVKKQSLLEDQHRRSVLSEVTSDHES